MIGIENDEYGSVHIPTIAYIVGSRTQNIFHNTLSTSTWWRRMHALWHMLMFLTKNSLLKFWDEHTLIWLLLESELVLAALADFQLNSCQSNFLGHCSLSVTKRLKSFKHVGKKLKDLIRVIRVNKGRINFQSQNIWIPLASDISIGIQRGWRLATIWWKMFQNSTGTINGD